MHFVHVKSYFRDPLINYIIVFLVQITYSWEIATQTKRGNRHDQLSPHSDQQDQG